MKTLKEQVEEIKIGKGSRTSKKEALVKLGLRPYEISLIMAELPKVVRENHVFTFGVEIECLVPRAAMIERAQNNNMPFKYEGYNHVDNNHYYKFVSDASICGENGIECVSPILEGKDGMKSLENCCKSLNEAGAVVNKSTGLHVHIGAAGMSDKQYINVFANYQKLEKVIDSFMARSRREDNNRFCKSLNEYYFTLCATKNDVSQILQSRYYKVNPCSYAAHKTIEFRQHQGSTDFEKISNWVNFCMKLVAWSKNNRLEREIQSIDEIPFLTAKEKKFFNSRREALN